MGITILCAVLLSTGIAESARPEGRACVPQGQPMTVDPAFRADGDGLFEKLLAMYVRNGVAELGLDAATDAGREQIARLTDGVRNELRDRALVYEEARRRGLPIDEHLSAKRARWIAKLGGERGYRTYLAEHHLRDAEFQRVIEHEIAGELLRDELMRDVQVSEEEVRAWYDAGRQDPKLDALFRAPATVTAGHILIAAREGLHSDIRERRARAERLRKQLIAGADFAALARQYSEDPGTSGRGGDLGTFTRDTHTDAFDAAAFALSPGEISPVIRTEYGFHIIRVTHRSAPRVRTLDELRPAIRQRLKTVKSAHHLAAWLQQQRSTAVPSTHRETH